MADITSQVPTTALLVEDELLVALHVEDMLESLGYARVELAGRVDEARGLLAGATNPAVAVLDVNLAGELSWPVARDCRRRGVPFLFVTGYLPDHAAVPDDLADCIILAKPVQREALRRGLAEAVARARRQD